MSDMQDMNILPKELVRQDVSTKNIVPIGAYSALSSGGYDFLLQASNAMCTEAAYKSLKLDWFAGNLDAQGIAALRAAGDLPLSAELRALVTSSSAESGPDYLILFEPKDVLFDTQTTCRVRVGVRVALGRLLRVPREPGLVHGLTPGEAVERFGEAVERFGVEVAGLTERAVLDFRQSVSAPQLSSASIGHALSVGSNISPPTMQVASGTISTRQYSGPKYQNNVTSHIPNLVEHVDLGDRTSFDVTAWLGGGILEIPAPFYVTGDQTVATMRVAADVSASPVHYTDLPHDAALLLSSADPFGLLALTTRRVHERGQLPLLDEISLVGGPAVRVNNLAHLSPAVFPCGQGACPLSVAATIVAWHVGTPTTNRFVGQSGYCVVLTAEAVSLLVQHSWETGWFPRTIPQTTPVTLTINGNEQSATAESLIKLKTLSSVTLEFDANGRSEVLHFGGIAQVVPWRILLIDGSELLPQDPNDPLFAPGELRPWNAIADLTEQELTEPSPDILQFENAITFGVTSRFGRPFTDSTAYHVVTFSRISVFSQRLLLLAE